MLDAAFVLAKRNLHLVTSGAATWGSFLESNDVMDLNIECKHWLGGPLTRWWISQNSKWVTDNNCLMHMVIYPWCLLLGIVRLTEFFWDLFRIADCCWSWVVLDAINEPLSSGRCSMKKLTKRFWRQLLAAMLVWGSHQLSLLEYSQFLGNPPVFIFRLCVAPWKKVLELRMTSYSMVHKWINP